MIESRELNEKILNQWTDCGEYQTKPVKSSPHFSLTSQSPCSKAGGASSTHPTLGILGHLCDQLGCQEAGGGRSRRRCCVERGGSRPGWGGTDRGRRGGEPGRAGHRGRGEQRRRRRRRRWRRRTEWQQQLLQIRLAGRRERGGVLQVELCHQQAGRAEDKEQLAAHDEGVRRR